MSGMPFQIPGLGMANNISGKENVAPANVKTEPVTNASGSQPGQSDHMDVDAPDTASVKPNPDTNMSNEDHAMDQQAAVETAEVRDEEMTFSKPEHIPEKDADAFVGSALESLLRSQMEDINSAHVDTQTHSNSTKPDQSNGVLGTVQANDVSVKSESPAIADSAAAGTDGTGSAVLSSSISGSEQTIPAATEPPMSGFADAQSTLSGPGVPGGYLEAEPEGDGEAPEWEVDSDPYVSPSDSSSDDSDSDSDSDSETDIKTQEEVLKEMRARLYEEDNAETSKSTGFALRTAHEMPEEIIPRPQIAITPETIIKPAGVIKHIIKQTVKENTEERTEVTIVIGPEELQQPQMKLQYKQPRTTSALPKGMLPSGKRPAEPVGVVDEVLDIKSVLCTSDRIVVGAVHDVMGPTFCPFYYVRFKTEAEFSELGLSAGTPIFYPVDNANKVFTSVLRQQEPGTDASNVHDEELPPDEMEFSDDEAELASKRAAKQEKRARNEARNDNNGGSRNDNKGKRGPGPRNPRGNAAFVPIPRETNNTTLKYDDEDDDGPYRPLARPPGLGSGISPSALPPRPPAGQSPQYGGGQRGGYRGRGDHRGHGNRGGSRFNDHRGFQQPSPQSHSVSPQPPATAQWNPNPAAGNSFRPPIPGQIPGLIPPPPPPQASGFNFQPWNSGNQQFPAYPPPPPPPPAVNYQSGIATGYGQPAIGAQPGAHPAWPINWQHTLMNAQGAHVNATAPPIPPPQFSGYYQGGQPQQPAQQQQPQQQPQQQQQQWIQQPQAPFQPPAPDTRYNGPT
ncbi:Gar1/Naf1 RNA binding region-domain-containing protein [Podospora australis]|uniref:H/ACA ribonucleoprotein complex non-core subunit NAF1 n=1 Tax=Podospora australis TaxID=1536484 RepID=A0AAN7AIV2_9PEZI|nr:Gar1/Naf1 RNA binding region-domain-containing protein [Podospora australis]